MGRFTLTAILQAGLMGLMVLGAGCESRDEPAAGPAAPADAAATIPAGPWRLTAMRRPDGSEPVVPADGSYTLEFTADGRYSGVAHCNRYGGGYEQPGPGSLSFSAGISTRMACPEPSLEYEFLAALGEAKRFEVDGDRLRLQYGEGGVLTFVRDSSSPRAATGRDSP